MSVKLLVGLGNPGERYRGTRHNLGWEALLLIIREYGLSAGGSRFKGRYGDGRVGKHKVGWLMPDTFMNLSGESVGAALRYFKLEPEDVIVFHDDLDLVPGFNKEERALIMPRIEALPGAIPALLDGDIPGAMNKAIQG